MKRWLLVLGLGAALSAACGSSDDSQILGPAGGNAGQAGAGGSAASGGTGGGGACQTNGDCGGATPVCDELAESCVQCLFDSHCDSDERCRGKACEKVVSCVNSLDCAEVSSAPICDRATGTCEQCVVPADCEGTADCVDNQCIAYVPCVNSLDCDTGQVCDTLRGRCVECNEASDCGDSHECVNNSCVEVIACQSDNQCTPHGLLCDKALGKCVRCLRHLDCPETHHCAAGECVADVCAAGESYCQNNSVVTCSDAGDSTQSTPCGSSLTCVKTGSGVSCQSSLCAPNQPVCDGDVARTCNADGTGYQPGGDDCAASGQSCVGGRCQSCSGGGRDALRLIEVNIGTADYVIIRNTGSCDVDLAGMWLWFRLNDSGDNTQNVLSSGVLRAGTSVVVAEQNTARGGDIDLGTSIYFAPDKAGYVLLCDGDCSNSSNIVDAFVYQDGGIVPPALPSPITFQPGPLSGIDATNEDTHAFLRVAQTGTSPSFRAGDWSVGPASREYQNPASCPASAPTPGDPCNPPGVSCTYGGNVCSCLLNQWWCS